MVKSNVLEPQEFTYFPNSKLNFSDLVRQVLEKCFDYDIHGVFDFDAISSQVENSSNTIFNSGPSSVKIKTKAKETGFRSSNCIYNFGNYSVIVNYETFSEFPDGILQLTFDGFESNHKLVDRIDAFCQSESTKKFDYHNDKPGD